MAKWIMERRGSGWCLRTDDTGELIAEGMTKANATLMGHAPNLLQACETMLKVVEGIADDSACQWVRDLIDQANGK